MLRKVCTRRKAGKFFRILESSKEEEERVIDLIPVPVSFQSLCVAKILCQFHLCTASNRNSSSKQQNEYRIFVSISFVFILLKHQEFHPMLIVYCLLCALNRANKANDCSGALAVCVLADSHQLDKIKSSSSKHTNSHQHEITGSIINSVAFQRIEKCIHRECIIMG